jgi:hypothetical protein
MLQQSSVGSFVQSDSMTVSPFWETSVRYKPVHSDPASPIWKADPLFKASQAVKLSRTKLVLHSLLTQRIPSPKSIAEEVTPTVQLKIDESVNEQVLDVSVYVNAP